MSNVRWNLAGERSPLLQRWNRYILPSGILQLNMNTGSFLCTLWSVSAVTRRRNKEDANFTSGADLWPFCGHALKSTHRIWHTQWITENVRFSTLGFLLDKHCSDEAGLEDGCYGEHIKNSKCTVTDYFWIFSSVNKISSVLTTCMLIIIHTFPPWHEPPPAWVFVFFLRVICPACPCLLFWRLHSLIPTHFILPVMTVELLRFHAASFHRDQWGVSGRVIDSGSFGTERCGESTALRDNGGDVR